MTSKDQRKVNDGEGANRRWQCRPGKACNRCGTCHSESRQVSVPAGASLETIRTTVLASVQRHETIHYPGAQMRLSDGQKVSFGDQTYLALKGRDLMLYSRDGRELVVYPPGTQIWKDAQGQAHVLHFSAPGEPRVLGR